MSTPSGTGGGGGSGPPGAAGSGPPGTGSGAGGEPPAGAPPPLPPAGGQGPTPPPPARPPPPQAARPNTIGGQRSMDIPRPDTAETVTISALPLLKMLKHGRAGVPFEVMGLMMGEFIDDYKITVTDVFAMPQTGTGVSVEAVDPVYQTTMMDMLSRTGRNEKVVGWYHSHPGFGCWLSQTDLGTQQHFEMLHEKAVAVVVDPIQSVKGKVVLDAFRSYGAGGGLLAQLNMLTKAIGMEQREVSSNLGNLERPTIHQVVHGVNRTYYKLNIDYRMNDFEQKLNMLTKAIGMEQREVSSNLLGNLERPTIHQVVHGVNRTYYKLNIDYRMNDFEQKLNMLTKAIGMEQREVSSNLLGNLERPTIHQVVHGVNRTYYKLNIDYRMNDFEQKILMALNRKAWPDMLTGSTETASAQAKLNQQSMVQMLKMTKLYKKKVEEEGVASTAETSVGSQNPVRHLDATSRRMLDDTVQHSLNYAVNTALFDGRC